MPKRIQTFKPKSNIKTVGHRQRSEDQRFYANSRWRKFRKEFLEDYPLCVRCAEDGKTVPAAHVHHFIARKIDPMMAFDRWNCMALCPSCHSRIEAKRKSEGGTPRDNGQKIH